MSGTGTLDEIDGTVKLWVVVAGKAGATATTDKGHVCRVSGVAKLVSAPSESVLYTGMATQRMEHRSGCSFHELSESSVSLFWGQFFGTLTQAAVRPTWLRSLGGGVFVSTAHKIETHDDEEDCQCD
jgi:hypothetical protein